MLGKADMPPAGKRVLRALSEQPGPTCVQCLEVLTGIDPMLLRDVTFELAAYRRIVIEIANCSLCTFPGQAVRLPKGT